MDDLVTWLRQQLDDDEQVARKARQLGEWWFASGDRSVDLHALTAHTMRWDPARVLAEVDAKRRILDRCAYELRTYVGSSSQVALAYLVLKQFALPYADRPGYRGEWKP